jgi:hypothetical protein
VVQSQPGQINSLRDPISKNPSQKRAGGVAQVVDPEFKPVPREKKLLFEIGTCILKKLKLQSYLLLKTCVYDRFKYRIASGDILIQKSICCLSEIHIELHVLYFYLLMLV